MPYPSLLRVAVEFMGWFVMVLLVALAAVFVANRMPASEPQTACQRVSDEQRPPGYQEWNGVRFPRDAYEVTVLDCPGGRITVRQ